MSAPTRPSNLMLAAFAGPCLPFAALGLPLVVHLPAFYAESVGLPLSVVGAVFMMVKLLDIGFDPVLGVMIDRTRTRWGAFRPWMAAATPILMIASYMLFMPPDGAGSIFLTTWLFVVYIGFSIVVVAQTSWASRLSPDYDQRSRIYGWWQAGNVVGMLLVLLLPVAITSGGGSQAEGVAAMGWFIIIALPLTVGLAVWRVPEPEAPPGAHASLKDYVGFLKSTSVRKLMLADLLFGLAPGVTGALALFYMKAEKGMGDAEANILIFAYFASGLVGAFLWGWVATKLGKHKALATAGLVYALAYVGVWLAPSGSFPLLLAAMVAVGVPFSAAPLLLRAMLADVGDEARLETGEDRTGMLYALLTATNKVGYAFAVLTYFPLEWAGFDKSPGAANTPGALRALEILFVVLPIGLLLAGSAVISRFKIDATRQAEIRAALEAKGLAR